MRREEEQETCSAPLTPLEVKPVVCSNEDNYPHHGNVQGDKVKQLGIPLCRRWKSKDVGFDAESFKDNLEDVYGVKYSYSVERTEGCVTTAVTQNVWSPMGDDGPTCPEIMHNDWKHCKANSGVGGYIDVGCLRYHFMGGQGEDLYG